MLAALIDLRQVGWTVHLLHDLYTVLWSFPALRFALVATFLVAPIGVVHAATISIPSGSSQQSDTNLYQLRYLDQQRDPVHRWHLRGRVRLCCAALRLGRASFETHTSRVEKVTVTPRNVLAADADHRRHRLSSARLVFLVACPTSDRRGTDGPVHNVCDHCLVVCDGIYRVGEKWFMRGVQFSQGSRLSGGLSTMRRERVWRGHQGARRYHRGSAASNSLAGNTIIAFGIPVAGPVRKHWLAGDPSCAW
jgi:hypothetical protein